MGYIPPRLRRNQQDEQNGEYVPPRLRRIKEEPSVKEKASSVVRPVTNAEVMNALQYKSGVMPSPDYDPGERIVGSDWFVSEPFPIKAKDPWYKKTGKAVGNFVASVFGAPGAAMREASIQGSNVIAGKGVQPYKRSTFVDDILPEKWGEAVNELEKNHPVIGGLAKTTIEGAADPTTYIGGGVVDDMAKAGLAGKASKTGTVENLMVNANRGQKSLKELGVASAPKGWDEPIKAPVVNPKTIPGTYRMQNRALDAANQRLYDGIETVQNRYGTDSLRADEMARVKSDTGVDFDKLFGDIQAAESKRLFTPDELRMRRVAGVASDKATDLTRRIARMEPMKPIDGTVDDVVKTVDNVPIGRTETAKAADNARIYGDTPKAQIPEGMKERGYSRNIRTDSAMPDDIRASFDEDPLAYKQITNNETLTKAQNIMNQGQEAAKAELYRSLGAKEFKPESVPLSKLIAQQAIKNGDIETARQVLSETASRLTEAGQFSQAAKILRESDPETFLMTIDKQLRKLNEQGLKQYGKKWNNIDLLPDEITAATNIPRGDQQAYEQVWEQIGQRVAKELPSTGMEKIDAWRRMAMLFNPKTHIRNIGGNAIMSVTRKASDTVGAALEKAFLPEGQRTKSFGWRFNKDLAAKVDTTWDAVKKDILGESRWEIDNLQALGREKRIFGKGLPTKAVEWATGHTFDRGALQWLNDLSLKTLNLEDNVFTKRAFKDALGQFMQANKLDIASDAAIAYAKRRALEATFKQANKLSAWINEAKQWKGVGKLVEGVIPFSKTPANIAARAAEYSPVGLLKLLYSRGKTPAEVIETLSKGLTGSAITALGVWLASMGWIKVERNRSDKAEGLMQELGDQPNSIITPLGSYTFDWAQPSAVPLAMGVAAYEAMSKRKDGDSLVESAVDGIAAGGDTIFNMTMMQNIKQIFGSGNSVSQKILGIPVAYIEQTIPSLSGQIARTVDDTKRNVYDPNPMKQEWNRVKSKIPGLSNSLEPSLDIWGREQSNGGGVQQFISPGYFKEKSNDPVTNEVARLYSSSKDTYMLPRVAPKSFTDDNVEYVLTPEQLTEFQRSMGQDNYNDIKRFMGSPIYGGMTDKQRIKNIARIVGNNYDDAKKYIIEESALK